MVSWFRVICLAHMGRAAHGCGCWVQALTALLSGEMRDTAELGLVSKFGVDMYLPRPSRAHMFRRCCGVGRGPSDTRFHGAHVVGEKTTTLSYQHIEWPLFILSR